jgi:hypothetical protein
MGVLHHRLTTTRPPTFVTVSENVLNREPRSAILSIGDFPNSILIVSAEAAAGCGAA